MKLCHIQFTLPCCDFFLRRFHIGRECLVIGSRSKNNVDILHDRCILIEYMDDMNMFAVQMIHSNTNLFISPQNLFCCDRKHRKLPQFDNRILMVGDKVRYSRNGRKFKPGRVWRMRPCKIKGDNNYRSKSYNFVKPEVSLVNKVEVSPEVEKKRKTTPQVTFLLFSDKNGPLFLG